ncbi:MAG: Dolichol-phosphate mannosyltransferase [Candidatus Gottesmanbacteria bacterium GW2011_GWB1_43_11]|uniref:Dolichol-phosphate mannosyltransferase n=1 Tax=Candidatus Gottesmanbacteria bacterium GW2011_GWB1_43_11 TaxID=1618446 RepID=A0A0G1CN83_9BACT|nr:MAG: Dolichol-phosphate mannosyltransferase [Candidatus Gottesmanbacteria bacterium GW2011_GWA2_42_16]KKS56151.1 MAG: Dolichol-phosphate mannosyltransferase [Candidatus Gottesmanbacteria bacterium GW2011_GWA1_42_26]KKS82472.1 MAG: Dolichol-phosphate mannosyltransferase [Candidatus Gottesmanbacteria bacterium GW2011_GWC1_43_10]KKS87195.1 MAG: Dolichol-phosphate mannosyltransferase [Candidatus Gottesmanbacteria bacterium GW2011_GWB1_43_11]OGG08484.1 MAG: hypothetical protein A2699_05325 [Candi
MISFIIPVYNKGKILAKALFLLTQELSRQGLRDYEIILVDDGSTDTSLKSALNFRNAYPVRKKIQILHYSQNFGKGFALQTGFTRSIGDPVVFLDGDLDIRPRQVVNKLRQFLHNSSDMLIASKYHPASRIYYPWNRVFYSLILKVVIRVLFHLNVSDTQVGLKIFRRNVLNQVFPRLVIKRFATDLELLVVAQIMGFSDITEVPVVIHHSPANQSTIDIRAVKNFLQDVAAIYYRKNILKFYTHENTDKALAFKPLLQSL